jgi:hypothetical protein
MKIAKLILITWSSRSVSRLLLLFGICLLTFTALIDPADDIFHLKVPAFILVILVWLWRRGLSRSTLTLRAWIIVLVTGVAIPALWTLLGLLHRNIHGPDLNIGGTAKAFLFLFVLPVIVNEDIDLASLVSRMSCLVALLIVCLVGVSFFFPPVFEAFYAFSIEKNNAIITTSRDLLGIGVGQFYYKTSALLVFPFSYYCNRLTLPGSPQLLSLLMCVLYAMALLFSGARANYLSGLFIAGFFFIGYLGRKAGWMAALTVAFAGIILIASTMVAKLASPTEESNAVKLLHVRSYEQEFGAHPSLLLWGQGADTAFYSEGFQDWTLTTEVTYLELIRVFGIPVSALFLAGLLCLGRRLFQNRRWALWVAFVTYLIMSGSNPLLISSTGFLAICAIWKEAEYPSTDRSAFHLLEPHRAASDTFLPFRIAPRRAAAPVSS